MPFAMATREIGAEIRRCQPGQIVKPCRLAKMIGEESEEGLEITPVGGDGMGRGAPLRGQPRQPFAGRRPHAGPGEEVA